VSHFLTLTLPPLFPFLRADFDLGYTELGLIMTLYAAATGIFQVPMGMLVDRKGAFPLLLTGLTVLCLSVAGIGLTNSPWTLGALAVLAGSANSVFHPANYAILGATVNPSRLGRAFGVHTFAGHFGNALAPITIIFLAVTWGWRAALVTVGAMGLMVTGAILLSGNPGDGDTQVARRSERARDGGKNQESNSLKFLFSSPLLKLFLFFVLTAAASNGMQTFSVTALVMLFDTPLVTASAALTVFLFASSVGILAGGILADFTSRHDLVAALAFALTAAIIALVGSVALPALLLMLLMGTAGLLQGVIRPARDMLVHAAAPEGATGKVFGFVTTGINVGGALMPLLLGWLVDRGAAEGVFWLIALVMVLALVTVLTTRQPTEPIRVPQEYD
jgi:MFS family permease